MARILLPFTITRQPDAVTCGAAVLHAVYRFWNVEVRLKDLIAQVRPVPGGGTAAVMLALHAMTHGFETSIYTCSLPMFDPTWFERETTADIRGCLVQQAAARVLDPKLAVISDAYLEFLDAGGTVRMADLTLDLIAGHLAEGMPLIMGVSSTWLYRCMRDRQDDMMRDDIAGQPTGHFLVVHGIDTDTRQAWVADPYLQKPFPGSREYQIDADRLIASMLLAVSTYDAKLLVMRPRQ